MIRQAAISAVAFVRSTAARRVARGCPMIRSPMGGGKKEGLVVGRTRVREMREKLERRLVRIGRHNRSLWYIRAARLEKIRNEN